MNQPLVSVCLPNRNTLPFLPERVDTIFAQTYRNWESIVSDNFSDDGAWPFFERIARKDGRVSIEQAPPEGMYANWNNCIRRAHGKYIYIATSDDTMPPDCLEELVTSIEAHPECDLAHCGLRLIDESGRQLENWYLHDIFALSSGQFIKIPHLRMAPFDGLLHLSGGTVYTSITQLLIRRELFDKIGLFETRWGSVGDFNWDMRAGLVANTIHVPDTWGGWRVHKGQATSRVDQHTIEHEGRIQEMIDHAIQATESLIAPATFQRLRSKWSTHSQRLRHFFDVVRERQDSTVLRRLFILRELLRGELAASSHIYARTASRPIWPELVRKWMRQVGVRTALVPL